MMSSDSSEYIVPVTSLHPSCDDVSTEDLADAAPRRKTSGIKTLVQRTLAAGLCLLLAIILVRGAQPELSPKQIVQLESYGGMQQARTIFNLSSVHSDQGKGESAALSASDRRGVDQAVAQVPTIAASNATVLALPGVEVPAAAVTTAEGESTLSNAVPSQVVSDIIGRQVSALQSAEPSRSVAARALPVYSVVEEGVRLHQAPSSTSGVIRSISSAESVTLFHSDGEWAEVAANDGSGDTGYVRRSAIRELQR